MKDKEVKTVVLFTLGFALAGCMSLEEKLASEDYEIRKEGEIELYQKAARTGCEEEVRKAVGRMSCGEVLGAIVMGKNPDDVKELAVDRIKDDNILLALAIHGEDLHIQELAVGKMTDQSHLLAAYESLTNTGLKAKALVNMSSATIASLPYDSCMASRWSTVSNATILAEIIEKDLCTVPENEWEPLIAGTVKKAEPSLMIDIENALAYWYANNYDSMSEESRAVLVRNLKNQKILEQMVTKPSESEIRQMKWKWERKVDDARRKVEKAESMVQSARQHIKWCEDNWAILQIKEAKEDLEKAKQQCIQAKKDEERVVSDTPRFVYVKNEAGRSALYDKLEDDVLLRLVSNKMKQLPDFHESKDFVKWEEVNSMVVRIKNHGSRSGLYGKLLELIAKDEEESNGKSGVVPFFGLSYTNYRWGMKDTLKAERFVAMWDLDKHPDVVRKILLDNAPGWKYVMKYASPEMVAQMFKAGMFRSGQLKMAAARKINSQDIDLNLYNSIDDDDVKSVLLSRMSRAVKSEVQKANDDEINVLLKTSKEKATSTFSLNGFYLGMSLADARKLLEHFFPDANVKMSEKFIDVDVSPSHGMHFCEADVNGVVYRLNFNVKMLKKWYQFDVQDYSEWAQKYAEETNVRLVRRQVKGEKNLEDAWVSVRQEVYSYVNNPKGYKVTYFGEKDISNVHGSEDIDLTVGNDFESGYREGQRLGRIAVCKKWPKDGWENGIGAREGTLRVEVLKDE